MSAAANENQRFGYIQRETVCLPDIARDTVLHAGDASFPEALQQYFVSPESNAIEQLIYLKAKLRLASTHDFWNIVLKEICEITSSQCSFVSKRILLDDESTAVEMPLGEPGSCLMGVGFYLTQPDGSPGTIYRDYQYHAYGAPCEYMKHNKVFIIPQRMTEFIPNNPNVLPFKSEAYIGVPLFFQGKCFAHFGMIWSDEGARKRTLGWGFIEMFLHALEDMILQRILEGKGFARDPVAEGQVKIIPFDAITASQSLKPYARSLSHELRTPMQGVVGMLDIMYSTVVASIVSQPHEHVRAIFEDLKENIQQAQDSSKRAVEAADAVVHAYDLNMQMPETPLPSPNAVDSPSDTILEKFGISLSPKRKQSGDHDFYSGPPLKKLAHTNESEMSPFYDNPQNEQYADGTEYASLSLERDWTKEVAASPSRTLVGGYSPRNQIGELIPNGHIKIKEFLQEVLNQSLEDEHPERKIHTPNDRGETIEVRTRGAKGEAIDQTITLYIDEDVPEIIIADEAVLELVIHKVINNAIKFTDTGNITITVTVSQNPAVLEIRITDQGCGITAEAQTHLFKPFSQQDASMSRQKEGLGMGLYIAKARIRQNLGGDLILEKSETDGPDKGSQFLIRLPISVTDFSLRDERLNTTTESDDSDVAILSSKSLPTSKSNNEYLIVHSTPATSLQRSPTPCLYRSTTFSSRNTPYNPRLAKDHPLTFLIAEDNGLNRKLLLKCLESLGYPKGDILVASDGNEAVELYRLEIKKRNIDVILMDLWMPNLDGYQATERILEIYRKVNRGDHGYQEPVIMAVTADVTTESQERARQVGMKGFMSKPYKVIDVQHLIQEHFRLQRKIGGGSGGVRE